MGVVEIDTCASWALSVEGCWKWAPEIPPEFGCVFIERVRLPKRLVAWQLGRINRADEVEPLGFVIVREVRLVKK